MKSIQYVISWYKLKELCYILSAMNLTFRFLSLFSYSYIWYQEQESKSAKFWAAQLLLEPVETWDERDFFWTGLAEIICHKSDIKY